MDKMVRLLFKMSKPLTVALINGLFGDAFGPEDVQAIHYSNTEWIGDDLKRYVGDLHLRLITTLGVFRYHIEFQTLNDHTMAIRMFHYGLEMALEEAAGREDHESALLEDGLSLLVFPRQLVIFLEENDAVGDSISFRLRLPDGAEIVYKVPAMRYWQLSPGQLQENRMYALLPLQVFKVRKGLRRIANGGQSEEEKQQLMEEQFAELKKTVRETVGVIADLHDRKLLATRDMDRMLRVMSSISNYLYSNYGEPYQQTKKEVFVLIKSFYDPALVEKGRAEGWQKGLQAGRQEGRQEGKVQVARKMLSLNMDVQTVVLATELTLEEVEQLRDNGR